MDLAVMWSTLFFECLFWSFLISGVCQLGEVNVPYKLYHKLEVEGDLA